MTGSPTDGSETFQVIDEVPVDTADASVYEEGWQSWSPTRWYPVTATPIRPRHAWQHTMRFRPDAVLPEHGFQGEGLLAVDPGAGEPVRVYGADRADEHLPSVRAELRGDHVVVSVGNAPPESVVRTRVPDPVAALTLFGDRFASSAGTAVRAAPTVWCTWYRYFLDVDEDDVLENVAAIEDEGLPVGVVQVDDGWQAAVGDWTALSDRFSSLQRVSDEVRAVGRRPGIWLAPFVVDPTSDLATRHPDWLVGDGGTNWGQRLGGLDLTHPGARDHLWHAFRELREQGFDYFKLDFVYAGAVPGARYEDSTGIAAYRSGLELVRDAVGPDAYLLGCGAPVLPSVGLVDAMRVSPDTFHPDGQDGSRGLRGEPGVVARAWQHGRFWVNDPDCFVGRPAYALREEWAGVIERHGGLRSFSDRVAELDRWGLDTARRLLATAPPAVPFPDSSLRRP